MSSDHSPPESPLAEAGLRLLEQWSRYSKARSIYPDTNKRVRADLDGLIDAIQSLHAIPGSCQDGLLQITFRAGSIRVDQVTVELNGHDDLRWLQERLDKALVAGIRLDETVPPESLTSFTERLIDLYKQANLPQDFNALWTEPYVGIELIERRFDGSFVGGEGDDLLSGHTFGGRDGYDPGKVEALTELVLEDADLAVQYEILQDKISSLTAADESTVRIDVLGRLIRMMPADLLRDPKQLVVAVGEALQELEVWVAQASKDTEGLAQQMRQEQEWRRLLRRVGQRIYSRLGQDAEEVADEARERMQAEDEVGVELEKGHAGDEAFQEDERKFFEAYEALCAEAEPITTLEPLEVGPELLASLLGTFRVAARPSHPRLVVGEQDRRFDPRNLAAHLKRVLTDAGPETLRLLRQYLELEPHEGDEPFTAEERRSLTEFLGAFGLTHVLREAGVLTPEAMGRTFPQHFELYLDTLRPGEEDRKALVALARTLGAQRILDAAAYLTAEGVLTPERLERLFPLPADRAMVPFLHVLLQADERHDDLAIEYLRRIPQFDDEDGCLLRLIKDKRRIPNDYLQAITAPNQRTISKVNLHHRMSHILVEFVRATVGQRAEERAYPVLHLGKYQSSEAEMLLREILAPKLFGREQPAVRRSAKEALKAYTV